MPAGFDIHLCRCDTMNLTRLFEALSLSIGRCNQLLDEASRLHSLVAETDGLSPEQKKVVMEFSDSCLRRSKSIFALLADGDVWSADVLLRTLVEGTAKFSYLFYKTEGRADRFDEYLRILPEIDEIRTSERAEQTLSLFPDRNQYSLIAHMILSPEELGRLEAKYPGKLKRSIEAKWTFIRLVAEVDSVHNPVVGPLQMFLHQYTGSSRIAHMDSVGIRAGAERERRGEARAALSNAAHASRIVTDCFSCAAIRLSYGLRNAKQDFALLENLVDRFESSVLPINLSIQELARKDADYHRDLLRKARSALNT